jgi:hypothetical protein
MQLLGPAIECLRQGPLPEQLDLSKTRAETDGHANDFSMRRCAQPLRGWSAPSSIRQRPLDVECFFQRLKAAIRRERLFPVLEYMQRKQCVDAARSNSISAMFTLPSLRLARRGGA